MRLRLTRSRVWAVRGLAVIADLLQLGLAPLFLEGGLSPFDLVLDVAMAGILTWLLGWHWAFLPSFLAELVPGLDLVPTWTLAVFFATRGTGAPRSRPAERSPETPADGRVIDVEPVREPPRGPDQLPGTKNRDL
jgi:hypothetical protein